MSPSCRSLQLKTELSYWRIWQHAERSDTRHKNWCRLRINEPNVLSACHWQHISVIRKSSEICTSFTLNHGKIQESARNLSGVRRHKSMGFHLWRLNRHLLDNIDRPFRTLTLFFLSTSPIVCLFLFRPLEYGGKFTTGTCSPRPGWGTITQRKNIVKISEGRAVRQGRGINSLMISPEFLPGARVTWKQHKWWHILSQYHGEIEPWHSF